LFKLSKLNWFL